MSRLAVLGSGGSPIVGEGRKGGRKDGRRGKHGWQLTIISPLLPGIIGRRLETNHAGNREGQAF